MARRTDPTPPLTKARLAAEVQRKLHNDVPRKVVQEMLTALQEITHKELRQGRSVTLPGIVKLRVTQVPRRSARQGINPATGEAMRIPAKPAHRKVKAKLIQPTRTAVGPRG